MTCYKLRGDKDIKEKKPQFIETCRIIFMKLSQKLPNVNQACKLIELKYDSSY